MPCQDFVDEGDDEDDEESFEGDDDEEEFGVRAESSSCLCVLTSRHRACVQAEELAALKREALAGAEAKLAARRGGRAASASAAAEQKLYDAEDEQGDGEGDDAEDAEDGEGDSEGDDEEMDGGEGDEGDQEMEEETAGAGGAGVGPGVDSMAAIGKLMAMEGPIVSVVILHENGKTEQRVSPTATLAVSLWSHALMLAALDACCRRWI